MQAYWCTKFVYARKNSCFSQLQRYFVNNSEKAGEGKACKYSLLNIHRVIRENNLYILELIILKLSLCFNINFQK